MLFFNGCGCQNPCSGNFIQGPQGIPGPRGPAGPQGPNGASLVASFQNLATPEIATGLTIPLTTTLFNNTDTVTHVPLSPFVLLAPGSYLVQYSGNATSGTAGAVNLSLQTNGVTTNTATNTIAIDETANLAGQTVVTLGAPGTINLANTGAETTTYTDVNLTVQPLTQTTTPTT